MAQIFFSYASADRTRIQPIVARLEHLGWSIFWDRKTPVGMSWEDHIHRQLEQSECVLVAWSQTAVGSDWVREEALHGKQRGCLVPLLLEPVAPPFGFGQIQCADLSRAGDDPQDPEWLGLVAAIERLLPGPAEVEPQTLDRPPPQKPATTAEPHPEPQPDYSGHWQRLLNARDNESLGDLAAEVQALRALHPTDPELIKLQRKITEAETRSRPAQVPPKPLARRPLWSRALSPALAAALLAAIGIGVYLQDEQQTRSIPTKPPTQTEVPDTVLGPKSVSLLPALVEIPAGCFEMGGTSWDVDAEETERPPHKVCLKAFQISQREISFAEYDRLLVAAPQELPSYSWGALQPGWIEKPDDQGWGRDIQPAININWNEASLYADWLSLRLGRVCRLPSEAEWEYAARAGSESRYPWGDKFESGKANCAGCGSRWDTLKPAPVGQFAPNAWGLYDTAGNVWEWVEDCWHDNYEGAPTDGSSWSRADVDNCRRAVLRGGAWDTPISTLRASHRASDTLDDRSPSIGFRVVCEP